MNVRGISYNDRIISFKQAMEYINQGYFAADLHCHTAFSYDVPDVPETSPENVIKEQLWKGLRPVISDHDTMNGYYHIMNSKKVSDARKELVIPAVEMTIKPVKASLVDIKGEMHTLHINVFGLNNTHLEVLKKIALEGDLDAFTAYLKINDLDYMYNHPFWYASKEKLNWKVIPGLAKNYFDVIELNNTFPKSMNDLALHLAEQFNKGIVSSSDSHIGKPGTSFVIAEGKNFKEFWSNVKRGKMFIVRNDITTLGIVKETTQIISNIFNARVDTTEDKAYVSSIGVKLIDKISAVVTTGKLKNQRILKKVMSMIFHALNYSAGPILAWKIYISKQDNFAEKLRSRIIRITNNLKDSKYKIIKYDKRISKNIEA
jgi:predicted metal-dependent phosphoesterase TrpH